MPEDLTIVVATAVLSVVTTYVAMITKIRRDLEAQYDKDLRDRRLTAYGALWALSEPLARYSPSGDLSPHGARLLSQRLRKWYFRNGMVLSAKARKAYFDLQDELTAKPIAAASARTEPLGEADLKKLKDASRAMHTALCGDVGSRRPPMIGFGDRGWRRLWTFLSGDPKEPNEGPQEDGRGAITGTGALSQ